MKEKSLLPDFRFDWIASRFPPSVSIFDEALFVEFLDASLQVHKCILVYDTFIKEQSFQYVIEKYKTL